MSAPEPKSVDPRSLFPEWERARYDANFYALRCLAHRLRKFGFEEVVNKLDPRSQVLLATLVHEPLSSALMREAESRGFRYG